MEITIHSSRLKRDVRGEVSSHAEEEYTRAFNTFLNGKIPDSELTLRVGRVLPVFTDTLPEGVEWLIEVHAAPPVWQVRAHIVKRFKAHLRHPRVVDGSDVLVEFVDE